MIKNSNPVLIILIIFFSSCNLFGQTKYSYDVKLKSFQIDLSRFIVNRETVYSVYSDIDIIRGTSNPRSYGIRTSLEIVDINSITSGKNEGYPIKNLSLSLRASAKPSNFQISGLLSFINTYSLPNTDNNKNGTNFRLEIESMAFLFENVLGLKFKYHVPLNFRDERSFGFIGVGIVFGYNRN